MNIIAWVKTKPTLLHFLRSAHGLFIGLKGVFQWKTGALEHLKSSFSFFMRSSHVLGRPVNITIEPTNICNLRCPVCETGAGILERPPQYMKLDQFQTIIDKVYRHTNTLNFYFMGEPFLNPHAYEMIHYAKNKNIPFVTTCSNGEYIDAEKVIQSGLDEINIQIGGMTQETHQIYRVSGQLGTALKKLEDLIKEKRNTQSSLRIVGGFIVMKHNEHEVEAFINYMKQIGVDDYNVISPCVRTIEQGKNFLPENRDYWIYDEEAFASKKLMPRVKPHNSCPWLYYSMTVMVDGNVVPCCRDPRGNFVMGNLLEESVDTIWNSEKFLDFRRAILANQTRMSICQLCSSYGISALKSR